MGLETGCICFCSVSVRGCVEKVRGKIIILSRTFLVRIKKVPSTFAARRSE